MLRFENPIYFWLLLVVPVLLVIYFLAWRQRRKKMHKLGDPALLEQLMPDVSRFRPLVKFLLLLLALVVLVCMLARPQMGTKISHEKRSGIETIIALDISNSMMAEDVQPSRLAKSKLLVENLVDHFTNDRIGLVVFAGDAFVQLPITSDYVSAKMFLQNIDPSLIQLQGTDLARAIKLSASSFTQQDKVGKAIIIITDGEDHEGGAMQAAKDAHQKGMNVFVLGVGNPKGAPIPDGQGGYIRDNAGQTVMSALNEDMCRQIAQAGNGIYIHVDNTNKAQEQLNDELTKLQNGQTSSVVYSEYNEQFQAFGLILILLLVLEICIMDSRNPLIKRIHLFGKRFGMLALFAVIGFVSVHAQTDRHYIRSGNRLFHQQNYAKAEVEYRKALSKNGANPQALYNLGCALTMQQKDSLANVYYEKAGRLETSKLRKAQSYHNIGVLFQRHQMYGEAIEAYKEALRNNPADNETRYNLALCKHLQKKQPPKKQPQNKQDDKKEKDKNKDNQKDKQDKNKQNQQQNKPSQEKMSKENAEQLLNAAMQEEQNTQQRLKKAMSAPRSRRLLKNW